MGIIENSNKKFNENEKYYFASYINSEGYVFELLLTEKEFDKAVKRAEKNPEDIPNEYIVLQGYKGKKVEK
jgi:hypothetical protein